MSDNSGDGGLMQAFFAPAVALMSRLNIARKFVLLGLMALAAIAAVIYSLFTSLDPVIDASRRELQGFELIAPLPRVIQTIQQHRGISAALLSGDHAMHDHRASVESGVAAALRAMGDKLPRGLSSGAAWQRIRADWERLREVGLTWTVEENLAAHTALIERLRSFNEQVADDYAMILDPEISSYYLIDTIINKLPHATEHLGQLRAYGICTLAAKQASPQQQTKIVILTAQLDEALKDLEKNLAKASRHNPALKNRIDAASKNIAGSAQRLNKLVTLHVLDGRFAAHPADFFRESTDAIDQSYAQLHEALLPASKTLIEARIARAQNTLQFSVGFAVLLFLFIAYFSAAISRAVVGNIRQLVRSAQAIANGNLEERVYLKTSDELDQIGDSFNQMAFGFSALLEASRRNEARLKDLSEHLEERVQDRTTELELAQRQTGALLNRYKTLMATSMDGIHIMDMQCKLVEFNDAFCQMLGYTREEMSAFRVTDWDAQWNEDQLREKFKALSGKKAMVETMHRRKDGTLIEVEISVSGATIDGENFIVASSRDVTLRNRAERELFESRALLGATFDLATVGIARVAPDSHWLDVNRKLCEIVGYTREELLARTFQDITHPDDLDADLNYVRQMLSGEISTYSMDKRYLRKDGEIVWVNLSVALARRADGTPDYFISVIEDITARRQAEAALKQHKVMIDTAIDGFWTNDLAGYLREANEAYAKISGYSVDELTGMHISQLEALEQSPEAVGKHMEKIIAQGYDRFETRHRHKDGHEIDIEVSVTYLAESRQFFAFCHDITGRKRAQAELQRRQDLLNEAQRLGQLGSWELDIASGELRWSDEIYRIFELDPAQFSPSHEKFLEVIHPDDRDKVEQAYARSLEERQPRDVQHRLLLGDGRIKWVREHFTSEFDASGKALRSLGAVQDVTGQKLAEDALRVAAAAFETHEAIVITDANANIIRVNQAFAKITGYQPEEVLGKNPRILSSGRQDKAFYQEMWQQLLDKGSWAGEIWDRHKGGQVYPKWLTITAVKNAQGKTTEYVASFSDITARKQAEEEIRNLAFYDALTALPNRRLLLDRFHLALSASARSRNFGAVLFLDMDKFKTLNDTLGHDYGDLMLIEVGRRIRSCVREADTVARLGGDEFVMLIEEIGDNPEESSQKVASIAEKIRAALAEPYRLKEQEYHSSPSIGVCLYRGNQEPVDMLLKHADMAMYQAKESGRNAVRFFDPAMQHAVETHAALEADLRRALPQHQLQLHYQIQVDNEHRALGAEALVRWNHPQRGMVSPMQFIPIAEESSLILDIGNWVLDTACQQLALWGKHKQTRDMELAVNVSAQQFRRHDFVETVAATVRKHEANPARLKLELTESVVLGDIADVAAKMHALKALGIKLSLGDFGTGYSSLSYLKQLPLDQIKIDQSFVRDIATDPNDAVMVQTIIDLAQNFRLNVIAEGVETGAQLDFLKQSGCMSYQGYLFGKPMPAEELEKLLGLA